VPKPGIPKRELPSSSIGLSLLIVYSSELRVSVTSVEPAIPDLMYWLQLVRKVIAKHSKGI
jgi:hypothetical protein